MVPLEEKILQVVLYIVLCVVFWILGHALDIDNAEFAKREEEKKEKKRKKKIKKYFS